jgi:hypothetical protein
MRASAAIDLHKIARPEIRNAGRIKGDHLRTGCSLFVHGEQHGSSRSSTAHQPIIWHHIPMLDEQPLTLRQADPVRTSEITLRNAKSEIELAFEDANDAASGFLAALSQTDNALYRALQMIFGFVKSGENQPEEFETFKRAKGIKRGYNAKSLFQHYVKYFIKANTDRKEILGRASKYGTALDEAWEQGISVEGFGEWIKDRGIENTCKERRRRNALRKSRREAPQEVVSESPDPTSAQVCIPLLPSGNPLSHLTSRLVLKLSNQAEECDNPETRDNFLAQLQRLASHSGMDSESLVELAKEHDIITRSLEQWGDDDRGREIARLRVILHQHGISWG